MTATRMAGADATWLHMDRPHNLMLVQTVLWFEGEADWGAIVESFFERVVARFEVFGSRPLDPPVTLGLLAPRWQPVEVNRADHIRRVRLPHPGGTAQLHRYIAKQLSTPLDRRVPLWQLHLIDGFEQGGAILLRTHHAIGDGSALVRMLVTWAGAEPQRDRGSMGGGAGRSASPGGGITADAGMLVKLVAGLPTRAGLLGEDLSGVKSVAWTAPVPLDRIKRLSAATGSTVNDVALAFVAGALRRSVEGAAKSGRVEAIIPVNLRTQEPPFETGMGNHFGLVFTTLPTDVGDLRERIARVKADMDRIKSTHEARIVFDALTAIGATPQSGAQAWVDSFSRRASLIVTNIAFPMYTLTIGSSQIKGIVAWVPTTGPLGLGVSICSYAGVVRLGVNADTAVMPDPGPFTLALDAEIDSAPTLP
jgi:diacylglycerol O-acyltransferase / wax synthase